MNGKKAALKKALSVTLTAAVIMAAAVGITGCGATAEKDPNAIKVGTTVKTKIKAEKDKKYHSVSYKVTSIVRDSAKVKKYINSYNASGKSTTIPSLDSKNVEYCVIKYEVKFPSDYPQSEFGITNVTLPFKIEGENGGDIESGGKVYKSLSKTYEIGDVPMGYDFHAGDTYKGRALFMMVKDYDMYEITESYTSGDKKVTHYIQGE
jgi:hypothetical protein